MRQQSASSSAISNPRPDIITDKFVVMLKKAGVVEAYLFGSVLRGEENDKSDIDVFVRFGHDRGLAEQLDLMVKLSWLTGREVDLLTRQSSTLVPIPL